MRIFEIAGQPLTVVRTEKFHSNFLRFAKSNPSIVDALEAFVEFKTHNPMQQNSRKDTAFNNKRLKGYRHEHLVLGKVLIIYQIAAGQLRLCDCVEHKAIDGAARSLIAYLDGLSDGSFIKPTATVTTLSHQERKEIIGLLYDLSQEDGVLEAVLSGDFSELTLWVEATVPRPFQDVLKAFGGSQGLADEVKTVLTNVGKPH